MGALCSKEGKKDNFAGPGRVLGSVPVQRTNAPVPSTASQPRPAPSNTAPQGPGQVLGSSNAGEDPREAAARAAEVSEDLIEFFNVWHMLQPRRLRTQAPIAIQN